MHTSVQMVFLPSPDPGETARYYVDILGYRRMHEDEGEITLDGPGLQLVLTPGDGPAPGPLDRDRAVELPVNMAHMEAAWRRDAGGGDAREGPLLDPHGQFVYLTHDPAGNLLALVTPLPETTTGDGDDEALGRDLRSQDD